MAYTAAQLPLTGAGDATAAPAVDRINGADFQGVKLFDGTEGSSLGIVGKATTPGAADVGLVVRPIGSTAFAQWILGDVALTSVGSTRLVGRVTIDSPSTVVTVNGQVGLSSGSSAVELTSAGSTRTVGVVTIGNPTTGVTVTGAVGITSGSSAVDLTSAGSTRVVGTVNLTSGSILGAGSSANTLGAVALVAGTSANIIGSVVNAPATTATLIGAVAVSSGVVLGAGSTANTLGSVAILAGGSTVGSVQQGLGSSANVWILDGFAYSSANTSRSTANTTVDASIVAANSNRRGLVIQNLTTVDLALGFSTAAITTALANVSYILASRENISFGGLMGKLPLFTGPIRGLIVGSTTITGGVAVTQFTNT